MSATRAYRSKIGRLPFAVRTELNERIRDGATGTAILEWINTHPAWLKINRELGAASVSPQNLTDWRGTGYKDWLGEQDKTARLRSLASLSQSIALQTGGDPAAVGARILTAKLLDALEEADPITQGELVKAFASLRAGEADAQRVQIARDKNDLARQSLALDLQKFQRQTCELFLKWHNNQQALSIATGPGTNDDKIQALLRFMDKEESR
jgi:hypothetical protein